MTGWRDDLGPWKPVLEGDRLYGRGGADDGYAAFASLLAIEAAQLAGHAARPLRRAHRGQRGERQPRPARVHRAARATASARPAWCCASTRAASTTSGCGSPRRCAAWSPATLRVDILTRRRALAARPAAWCRRRSASSASCSTASRTARPDACCCPSCTSTSRPTVVAQAARDRRRVPHRRPLPVRRRRRSRWPTTRSSSCSPSTWRPTLSVTGVDGMPARRRRPATCCARTPRCSSACASRPRATPTPRSRRSRDCLTADPPYGATVQFLDGACRPGLERPAVRAVARRRARRGLDRSRSASRTVPSARAARSRSWACSAPSSPTPSSSSPACSAPARTRTARTSTSSCPRRGASPRCLAHLLHAHATR